MFVVRFEKYPQNIFHVIKSKYFGPNSHIFKMSEYDQKKNENTYQYKNRIFALWQEDRKNSKKNNEKIFIRIFIAGIFNYTVKEKMQKWLSKEKNPGISEVVRVTDNYQDEQDEENFLPDFDDIENNNDCYGAGHICT